MDYQFLIELGVSLLFGAYALKKVTEWRIKQVNAQARVQLKPNGPFQGVSQVVSNVDSILGEMYKMRDEQQAAIVRSYKEQGKAASEEELKKAMEPLNGRIKWLERIKDNKQWLQYVSPYVDEIVDAGLKVVKNVARSLG